MSAFWDTAVAGPSTRRAALAKAILGERAKEDTSVEHATLFRDVQASYNSLTFVLLMQASLEINYPIHHC